LLEEELRQNPHYSLTRDLVQLKPVQSFKTPVGTYKRSLLLAPAKASAQATSSRRRFHSVAIGGKSSYPEDRPFECRKVKRDESY
jgi:hypothetical protein